MDHLPIKHTEESIRLFKSDFLEFFTHISPITVYRDLAAHRSLFFSDCCQHRSL